MLRVILDELSQEIRSRVGFLPFPPPLRDCAFVSLLPTARVPWKRWIGVVRMGRYICLRECELDMRCGLGSVVGGKLSWLRSDVVVLSIARDDLAMDGRSCT